MRLADRIAHLVVQRPKTLVAATLLLVGICVWIVSAHQRFDSEVLNLLPKGSPEVQGLKVVNSEFREGSQLIFALRGEPAVIAEFQDQFVEALRAEPWVTRVLAGSPLESPQEIAALQNFVPQLLLNLPDEQFEKAVQALDPAALSARVRRLKADFEAGSPRAEMETTVDPIGIVFPALAPVAGTFKKTDTMASMDGTLHIFPVVTNQPSLGQADCRATMVKVEEFKQRVLASVIGEKPEILVTGRTAYVAQIASSMERDVSLTSTLSFIGSRFRIAWKNASRSS